MTHWWAVPQSQGDCPVFLCFCKTPVFPPSTSKFMGLSEGVLRNCRHLVQFRSCAMVRRRHFRLQEKSFCFSLFCRWRNGLGEVIELSESEWLLSFTWEAKPGVPTNSRSRIRTQASNLSIWLWHQLSSGRNTHVSWASAILAGKWECAHLRRLWWRLRQMHLCVPCTEHLFTRDDYCPHYHGKDVLQGYWIFWNAPGRSKGRYFGFELLQYPRELFLLPLNFCENVLSLPGWTNSFKCTLKWFR